jgi:hypothetical protein
MRRPGPPLLAVAAAAALGGLNALGCRDLSGFTTSHGDSYQGSVVAGDFVRAGVPAGTRLCLTLDTDHLQDGPGALWTDDGRFHAAPFRPIPQIWHDPLSTLSFGDGRLKNLVYVVRATTTFGDGDGDDVLAVVSLMQSGDVEVRLLRGAPPVPGGDGGASGGGAAGGNVFAVFDLTRQEGACAF